MSRAVPHTWTDEQNNYMKSIVPGRSRKGIRETFNKQFDLDLTMYQIVGHMERNNLKTGLTGRFEKGQKAWNEGLKGINTGSGKGRFEKGHVPITYKPVGSERVDGKDGYVIIKVLDESRQQQVWKHKHVVEWEKHNGEVPKSHVISFLDSDKTNTDIDNLVLLSRRDLIFMNQNELFSTDPNVTKTGITLVKLMKKASDLDLFDGETKGIRGYIAKAERNGIRKRTFMARLRNGWDLKDAIHKPLHYRFKN